MNSMKDMTPIELVKLHCKIIDELINRGIAQARNSPMSEYSKWLVINKLNLTSIKNPNEKYDGIGLDGRKYLIKSRQFDGNDNRNPIFGVIRDIKEKKFDYLITVIFDKDVKIVSSYIIPIDMLLEKYTYNNHQNGFVLNLNNLNLTDDRIQNIKYILDR